VFPHLMDRSGKVLGHVLVQRREGQRVIGKFHPIDLPEEILKVFTNHEEIVDGQMFSYLDESEAAIRALGLQVQMDADSPPVRVCDVQIMNGGIVFELP
jgi:hypothetical protein